MTIASSQIQATSGTANIERAIASQITTHRDLTLRAVTASISDCQGSHSIFTNIRPRIPSGNRNCRAYSINSDITHRATVAGDIQPPIMRQLPAIGDVQIPSAALKADLEVLSGRVRQQATIDAQSAGAPSATPHKRLSRTVHHVDSAYDIHHTSRYSSTTTNPEPTDRRCAAREIQGTISIITNSNIHCIGIHHTTADGASARGRLLRSTEAEVSNSGRSTRDVQSADAVRANTDANSFHIDGRRPADGHQSSAIRADFKSSTARQQATADVVAGARCAGSVADRGPSVVRNGAAGLIKRADTAVHADEHVIDAVERSARDIHGSHGARTVRNDE